MAVAGGRLERVQVPLQLEKGAPLTFWLLQPPAGELSHEAPYHHAIDSPTRPLELLRAAIALDAQQRLAGPVLFVVPELTLCGTTIESVRALGAALLPNRALILGYGHLREDQCEAIEPNTGKNPELWLRPWSDHHYANAAAVITRDSSHLEAKNWRSNYEYLAACHLPHTRLRIFQAAGFSFAVVICSELLTTAPGTYLERLARDDVDLVLWLQHNPHPRHSDFSPALGSLFRFTGDQRLVLSLNKQPDVGTRAPYGVTCAYAPAPSFGAKKDRVLRPNFATEPLAEDAHEVSRAVFVRYDAAAHQLHTVLPAHIPAGGAPGQFMTELVPYRFADGSLRVSDEPEHYRTLFSAGEKSAWEQTGLDPTEAGLAAEIQGQLEQVKDQFFRSPSLLLNFLDTAFVRSSSSRHANHVAHSPAARCDCWAHRRNFDSLFETGMPARVVELLLAIAALRAAGHPVQPNEECVRETANLAVDDLKLVLGSSSVTLGDFVQEYFHHHHVTERPLMIVLRSERSIALPRSAARHAVVGRLNAARVAPITPRMISGPEFWQSVRDRTLADRFAIQGGDT